MSDDSNRPAQYRRSVTEKKRLLIEWQQSTLKMKDFCERNNVTLCSLKTWIKQYNIGRKRNVGMASDTGFITLVPEQAIGVGIAFAEYVSPDGGRLLINQSVSAAFLRELIYACK